MLKIEKNELRKRLIGLGCPYQLFPDSLSTRAFSDHFKTILKSKVFPTLKESLTRDTPVACIDFSGICGSPFKLDDLNFGFGCLYTYSFMEELDTKYTPVYVTRRRLQDLLSEGNKATSDSDFMLLRDSHLLFISCADQELEGQYTPIEIGRFSSFLYDRVENGLKTVLHFTSGLNKGCGLTPFVYNYLKTSSIKVKVSEGL